MGELSKPIMTPLGVVYRSMMDTAGHALKSSEWAVKMWGGTATTFNVIGPGKRGFYEAAILAKVPPEAKCVKPRKDPPIDWMQEPAHAYVLFDALETPLVLYFYKHELLYKPSMQMTAYHAMSLEQ